MYGHVNPACMASDCLNERLVIGSFSVSCDIEMNCHYNADCKYSESDGRSKCVCNEGFTGNGYECIEQDASCLFVSSKLVSNFGRTLCMRILVGAATHVNNHLISFPPIFRPIYATHTLRVCTMKISANLSASATKISSAMDARANWRPNA